jgi:hypothetical protein
MLKKTLLAAMIAASTLVAVPQAAHAVPDCYLNCLFIGTYDSAGNLIGGYWLCPGEQAECVEP